MQRPLLFAVAIFMAFMPSGCQHEHYEHEHDHHDHEHVHHAQSKPRPDATEPVSPGVTLDEDADHASAEHAHD